MNNISGDLNEYIRNIIKNTIKPRKGDYAEVAIYSSHLYAIVLNGIAYELDLTGKIPQDIQAGFDISDDPIISMGYYQFPNEIDGSSDYIFNEVMRKFNELKINETPERLIFDDPEIRDDPNFNQMITSSASAGASKYFINNSNLFIILYGGLFNVNKADTMQMSIFKTNNPNIKMAKFKIHKVKVKMDYFQYFLFMDFNN